MKKSLTTLLLLIVILIPELKSQDTLAIKKGTKTLEQNTKAQESEFEFVDVNAKFQGGDLEKFREWVQRNLVYPPMAVENDVQGRVMVQFCIDAKGKLVDSKILRSVDPLLDNEVLRVINLSPVWEPALLKGQSVKQQFVMPVIFALEVRKKRR